eukprot:scaffold374565_cov16-Prasinocladus_malaysianus.AAC.2
MLERSVEARPTNPGDVRAGGQTLLQKAVRRDAPDQQSIALAMTGMPSRCSKSGCVAACGTFSMIQPTPGSLTVWH